MQSMTAKELGEHYGVSEFTVRNWINKARKEEKDKGGKVDD